MSKVFTILHIRNGEIANPQALEKLYAALKEKDGRYLLSADRKNKRTNNQNAYYWMILTDYIQPALYNEGWNNIKTKDDAHEFISDLFLKVKVINEVSGDSWTRTKSTSELSTVEFNLYLEEIWQWAAEYLNVNIPSPNEQLIFNL